MVSDSSNRLSALALFSEGQLNLQDYGADLVQLLLELRVEGVVGLAGLDHALLQM